MSASTAEYLPPLVTKFLADTSELKQAFGDIEEDAKAFGKDVSVMLADDFKAAGRNGANGFRSEMDRAMRGWGNDLAVQSREAARKQTRAFGDETEKGMGDDVIPRMAKTGAKAGTEFGGSMLKTFGGIIGSFGGSDVGLALLISLAVVAAVPAAAALGALLGTAILLGLGGVFIGLGVLLLKDNPKIVTAAGNLGRTVKRVFTEAASGMAGPIERSIYLIENMVNRIGPQLKMAFDMMAPAIVPLADGFAGFVENALPGMLDGLNVAWHLVMQLAAALPALGEDVSYFFSTLAQGGPEFAITLHIMIDMLGKFIRISADVILWLVKLHVKIAQWSHATQEWFKGVAATVAGWGRSVSDWFSSVGATISGWYNSVRQWLGDLVTKIKDWFEGAGDSAGNFVTRMIEWFQALPGRIGAFIASIPERIRAMAVKAFDAFFYVAGFAITKLVLLWTGLPNRIGQALARLKQVVRDAWDAVYAWSLQLGVDLANWAKKTWSDIVAWFGRTGADLEAWARALPNRITVFFAQLWHSITSWVARTYHDVVGWFSRLPANVVIWLTDLGSRVSGWATGALGWLKQAGSDMIQGLINGVLGKIADAVAAVKRAIRNMIEGAQDALDSNSPSKVFMGLGGDSVDGYILGIRNNAGRVAAEWARALAPAGTTVSGAGEQRISQVMLANRSPAGRVQTVVQANLYMDGRQIHRALIAPAQQYKSRTGVTGLA